MWHGCKNYVTFFRDSVMIKLKKDAKNSSGMPSSSRAQFGSWLGDGTKLINFRIPSFFIRM